MDGGTAVTPDKITAAIAEAERFIAKATALRLRRFKGDLYDFQACKESGALRRASLDLTRTLADLRRPEA